MKKVTLFFILFASVGINNLSSQSNPIHNLIYNSSNIIVNSQTTEIINDSRFTNGKGIVLKTGVSAAIYGERPIPDITVNITAPVADRFEMRTYALTNAEGDAHFSNSTTKEQSLYMRMQFDAQTPLNRVIAVPWKVPLQEIGKFELSTTNKQLKIWLPRGVVLGYIDFKTYVPPTIPFPVSLYTPLHTPPASRPRLWVNQTMLPLIKSRLTTGENAQVWNNLKARALTPFSPLPDFSKEVLPNPALEDACIEKAFYYLMTNDATVGQEAVNLFNNYLTSVQFGNLLDVTRVMGAAIYSGALIYDWCYPLMTSVQKSNWYQAMILIAEDMEIGWPPFKQSVVNGHGNEAQMSRDLLSMSIAVYDEFPLPYKYTSYTILKDMIPMKQFEFLSPRHPQGVNYGSYRFTWDLHALLLYKQMHGINLLNTQTVRDLLKFWVYMRTPSGEMLRDGDQFFASETGGNYYWKAPMLQFLGYAYTNDPFYKSEFLKQGTITNMTPYLFLLLNDPQVTPGSAPYNLPLTIDFGDVTGGMLARTGWNDVDNDVVAEIRGGGYRSGGHQHSDAGAIQLYYRGFQFGDIGMYLFAGTPYDRNFNRRSVAHSMMLAVDPNEKFGYTPSNDGGARYNETFPKTPNAAKTIQEFNNGKVVSANFGLSKTEPTFSYFSVDLVGSYSAKISNYVRSFCFVNMKNTDIPAVMIVTDDISTTNAAFKKYWQINSLNLPVLTDNGFMLNNRAGGPLGRTHVNMLVPTAANRDIQVLSGNAAFTVDGVFYEPPPQNYLEKNGKRTLISPKQANEKDKFLTVFQVANAAATPLAIDYTNTPVSYVIRVADKIISMSNSSSLISESFQLNVPSDKAYQVALTGLKEGVWNIVNSSNITVFTFDVKARENSIFINSILADNYTISYSATGINDVDLDLDISINGKTITVLNLMEPITIHDMMGRILYTNSQKNIGQVNYTFHNSGIYIIKSGNKINKVIIH